jgi:hypothetical protein
MLDNPEKLELGQGQGYPEGFIKRKILLLIYNSPEGIKGGKIEDFLWTEYGIHQHSGRKIHLDDLEENEYIRSEWKSGGPRYFFPPKNIDSIPALLQDPMLWGKKPDFINLDEIEDENEVNRLKEITSDLLMLYQTKFFEQTVMNEIIDRLLSSPPFFESFKEKYHLDLKSVVESDDEKEALKNLYSRALSTSPYLKMHMLIPQPIIAAALHASQFNAALLDYIQTGGNEVQLSVKALTKVSKLMKKFRKTTNNIWEYQFTSLESFSLATVYTCLSFDTLMTEESRDIVCKFLNDDEIKKIFGRYIPNPFFVVEITKFIGSLYLFGESSESNL